jgi:hypothetical protein
MVVSFGRATFRLTDDSVGLAMEAALGGYCGELKVSLLRDRVFSFTVYSKLVGFHILSRRFYECFHFKCHFHLWSHGGPNWQREFVLWQKECDKEWISVSKSPSRPVSKQKRYANNSQHYVRKRHDIPPPTLKQKDSLQLKVSSVISDDSNQQGKVNSDQPVLAGSKVSNGLASSSATAEANGLISANSTAASDPPGLDGLMEVIDDIAFRFWECSRCLSMGHKSAQCVNDIRCRKCFSYGHIGKDCFAFYGKKSMKWIPKRQLIKESPWTLERLA